MSDPDFSAHPPPLAARLRQIRALIRAAAQATGTVPLTETTKWGQPAFLPAGRAGTTLRLGVEAGQPALFVHCQTDLISRYSTLFPTEFTYSARRAVLVPATGPFAEEAFQQVAAMALTYHRDRKRR